MYAHGCFSLITGMNTRSKMKIPFKNKCEWSESHRSDGITVDDEHVMAHTLLYSIHGKYV